jgi:outer membrane protein OmpA-like peptidoglycan-associated protein
MSRLENSGKEFRENLIARNLYTPTDIYDINNSKVTEALNSISRLLRPGNAFDFSNTILGRVVGPQTPITEIGRRALFNLFSEQVKSTIVRKKAPLINFDNLLRDDRKFISKNIDFSITKEDENNIQSKLFSLLRYSGVNSLSNPIRVKPVNDIRNYNTDELSKFYLSNTGKGQRQLLIDNLNNNIFSNNFNNIIQIDNTEYKTSLITKKTNTSFLNRHFNINTNDININLFIDNEFTEYFNKRYESKFYLPTDSDGNTFINKQSIEGDFGSNYFISKRFKEIDQFNDNDIVTLNESNRIFTWGVDQPETIRNSKGILGYTSALFNVLNNKNNAPFNKTVNSIEINGEKYYNGIRYGITDDNGNVTEARSYSINNQMDSISKTIKPFGYTNDNRKNSPLFKRPIPKVVIDSPTGENNNVMFSIENLAINSNEVFPLDQRGKQGKILWFAPIIESFNETISPNINTTNFLGRGEPVYTYANTERKLTMNFLMLVDHVEELVGVRNFNDFQSRLYNLSRITPNTNKKEVVNQGLANKRKEEISKEIKEKTETTINFESENFEDISFYFVNNSNILDSFYESTGLNLNFEAKVQNFINKLTNYFETNKNAKFSFDIIGYASALGNESYNQRLSERRANNLKSYIENLIIQTNPMLLDNVNIQINTIALGETQAVGTGDVFETAISIDTETAKKDRKATITNVKLQPGTEVVLKEEVITNLDEDIIRNLTSEREDVSDSMELDSVDITPTLNDEYDEVFGSERSDTFSKIKEYKYQNGITMYTPYALYDRLTFLNQCTRQGRTIENDTDFSNAVFGKPPIIIFRLGDMYNTKAIITSLTFDFENIIPWDLNPEGFGVQKMGCRVSMTMNLIGGSTVNGPVNHILNGESRRFYANSSFEINNNDKLDREEKINTNTEENI